MSTIAAFIFGLALGLFINFYRIKRLRKQTDLAWGLYRRAEANFRKYYTEEKDAELQEARSSYKRTTELHKRLVREARQPNKNYMPGVEYDPGAVIERLNGGIDKC